MILIPLMGQRRIPTLPLIFRMFQKKMKPPVQPDNEIENTDTTEQTTSDDDFEIIPAEAVPDDYDNYMTYSR